MIKKFWLILFTLMCMSLLAGSASATELINLTFDEESGNALDSSGYSHDATLGINTTRITGENGGGVHTDGTTNSMLTIADADDIDLLDTDVTICFKVRPHVDLNSISAQKRVIEKYTTTTNGYRVYISQYGSPRPLCFDIGDGSSHEAPGDYSAWTQYQWIKIVMIYDHDAKTLTTYRNGVAGTEKSYTVINSTLAAAPSTATLKLFSNTDADWDDFRIYNSVLSDSEILSYVYNGGTASNKNYYVSQSGDNNNSGSEEFPFRNIEFATSQALPGDTIYVNTGTWTEGSISFTYPGTAANPITITEYGGDVTFEGSGENCFDIDKNDIILDGFDFTGYEIPVTVSSANNVSVKNSTMSGYTDHAIEIITANNLTVDNISFYDTPYSGISIDDISQSTISYITAENVTYGLLGYDINNTVIDNFVCNDSTTGMEIYTSESSTFQNFKITNSSTDGIEFYTNNINPLVQNGYIQDTVLHGIHFTGAKTGVIVDNVTFFDNWHNQLDFHYSGTNLTARNCYFGYSPNKCVSLDYMSIYFHNDGFDTIYVDNCTFNYTPKPIELYDVSNFSITNNTFSHIQLNDSASLGRWLMIGTLSGETTVDGAGYGLIKNNTIDDVGIGISLYRDSALSEAGNTHLQDVVIEDNTITNISQNFFFFSTGYCILDNVTFRNNSVEKTGSNPGDLVYTNTSLISTSDVNFIDSDITVDYPLSQSFPHTFISTFGQVYTSSIGQLAYTPTGSQIYVTSSRALTPYNYSAVPTAGTATITPRTPVGSEECNFTAESTNGNLVTFSVWDLTPGYQYSIEEDGVQKSTQIANSTGYITWNNDAWSEHVYTVEDTGLRLPVCAFTANVTDGTAPTTIQFTDGSTQTPTSWSWDFNGDDVEDSTEQNPVWTYDTDGSYDVSLTVTNAIGSDTELKEDYIILTNPYVAPIILTTVAAALLFMRARRRW